MKRLLSVLPFIKNYFGGMITIFMLHRVSPFEQDKLFPNENMKVSPDFLDKFLADLKLKGYEFISIDRLYEILIKEEDVEKKVVITLDDGYKDNYEIAYPIFKKHNVPFCIYVTTSFPEKMAILWWYILEDLILENDIIKLSNGKIYECKTKEEKEQVFLEIRKIILSLPFQKDNLIKSLEDLFYDYKIDWMDKSKKNARELCLDWEEIVELSKDELCTIGGHTKNHYPLNRLSVEEIKAEILEANALLEKKIKKPIEHFAYPFGSKVEIGKREFHVVKNLGLKTATTTRPGTIYKEHKKFRECLPRIMLTEGFDINTVGNIRRQRIVTE